MSTTTVRATFDEAGVKFNPTSVKLSNNAGTAGVVRNDLDAKTISDATEANPCVVTVTAAHGYSDGQKINITAVVGMTQLNGNEYYVKSLSSTTFALYSDSDLATSVDSGGYTTYGSVGTVTPIEVDDATAMTNLSTGVYEYSFTDPAAGLTYTAHIEYVIDSETYWNDMTVAGGGAGSANLWTFDDYWSRMGLYMRNDSAPTGDAKTLYKQLVNDGYLMFLGEHDWSFLYPAATLSVSSAAEATDLPTGFGWMEEAFCYAPDSGVGLTTLDEISWEAMRAMKAAGSDATGPPRYFAIVAKTFVAATGQRHQVMWYPIPAADYTMQYRYRAEAAAMTNDSDYALGGQVHQLTILQAAKAMAEQSKDGAPGQQWAIYRGRGEQVGGMLARSMRLDLIHRARNLGLNLDRSDGPAGAPIQMSTWTHR